ncbi:MAG: hypothetical protein R3B55_01375 [Candidatus Paceibacterota bacterium]
MEGNILYPLNTLEDINPGVFNEVMKKYENREWLLGKKIPKLNCLWNDVIHMTAVHPSEFKDALLEAGHELKNFKWFKIPIKSLDSEKLVVYMYKEKMVGKKTLDNSEFEDFDIKKFNEYSKIGEKTKEYFKEKIKNNEEPLIFHMIPHILYKGNIDTSNLEIISTYPEL